jgi:glucose/arabinose dehydrogenase
MAQVPPPPRDEPRRLPLSFSGTDQAGTGQAGAEWLVPNVRTQSVANGLKRPSDIAVLADGTVIVAELDNGLSIAKPGQPRQALPLSPGLRIRDEGRLLGLAVDPRFEQTRRLFVLVASTQNDPTLRVARLTLDAQRTQVVGWADLIAGIPASREAASGVDPLASHSGSRLAFGPDGWLYVGLGDGRAPQAPQDRNDVRGKVLRIDSEGQGAAKEWLEGFDSRVVAVGFRNPVGLAFHPNNERLVVADRGREGPDEVLDVPNGAWRTWNPRCAAASARYCEKEADQLLPTAAQSAASTTASAVTAWRGPSPGAGARGLTVLRDLQWGRWNGALVVSFDRGQRIDLLKTDAEGRFVRSSTLLKSSDHGFGAVAQGPDGLYAVTLGKRGGDELLKFSIR